MSSYSSEFVRNLVGWCRMGPVVSVWYVGGNVRFLTSQQRVLRVDLAGPTFTDPRHETRDVVNVELDLWN
jgi:hypothetical protein